MFKHAGLSRPVLVKNRAEGGGFYKEKADCCTPVCSVVLRFCKSQKPNSRFSADSISANLADGKAEMRRSIFALSTPATPSTFTADSCLSTAASESALHIRRHGFQSSSGRRPTCFAHGQDWE